jgi:ankyrin repeat protein
MHESLDRALIAAAWRNDVEEAASLIGRGADVNAKDDTVQSAYLIATSEGFLSLLALTLEHGADVSSKDSYNGTGLIRAADRGHALTIGMLLRAGIEVNHINNVGWTALHEAIILGDGGERHQDCVRLLLAGGADPRIPSQGDGVSPLDHATSRGFETIATSLRTVIESAPPAEAMTALLAAAGNGDADGVMLALRAGADHAARDTNGDTALALAARPGLRDATRLLHAYAGPV